MKPYIGITGATSTFEVLKLCREFSDTGCSLETGHVPMIGVLASFKTLNNMLTSNRRYPLMGMLPKILNAVTNALPMIHYNSRELDTLPEQVEKLFSGVYHSGLCRALQLNIPWPETSSVARIKESFPEMQIVFQASKTAMESKTPEQIADGVKAYGNNLDYVLIDPSSGKGMPFDINASAVVYSELRSKCPDLAIGFAGGFTAENTAERLETLITRIGAKDFCIDAEGGLRDKISQEYGDDLLNFDKARAYVKAAFSILK